MPLHRRVTPSIKFTGTHLYTWVERGTARVKCLAQEHNTMSPARARAWTVQSRDERTNHEATARSMTCPRGEPDGFLVDVEAAGGDITCRCCQWSFLKASKKNNVMLSPVSCDPQLPLGPSRITQNPLPRPA